MYLDSYVNNVLNDVFRSSRYSAHPDNVIDDGEKVKIVLEVPGVSPEDLKISSHNGFLRVSGKSRLDKEFSFTYRLSKNVDESSISANLQDGLLEITMERAPSPKPREIKVHTN